MLLVGLSQPVLDLSVSVTAQFLARHDLALNQSYRVKEEEEEGLFAEVRRRQDVSFSAGGSTNNTLRVASTLLAQRGRRDAVGWSYLTAQTLWTSLIYFRLCRSSGPG